MKDDKENTPTNINRGPNTTPLSDNFEDEFSDDSFWLKLRKYASSAGKDVVELALKLYYTLRDPDTPDTAKAIIVGSLAYFIIPIDAVADLLPGGYVDDWGALMGALWTVSKHIKQEHADKAKEKLSEWFSDEAPTDANGGDNINT